MMEQFDDSQRRFDGWRLDPASAAALDALAGRGWAADAKAQEHGASLQRLFALLDTPTAATPRDSLLLDVTLLRVARLRELGIEESPLSEPDRACLDAICEGGAVPAGMGPPGAAEASLHARMNHQRRLLSLLDSERIDDAARESLIERTLRHVGAHQDREQSRMRIEPEEAKPRVRRIQFADMLSVAALLLIGAAVVMPVLSGMIDTNRRMSCQANLHAAGLGMSAYAGANRDVLPMASECRGGTPWWFVGHDPAKSNSANTFTLVRTGYADLDKLACAGNAAAAHGQAQADSMDWQAFDEVSYSSLLMFGRTNRTIGTNAESVLLVDRSPVVVRSRRGDRWINPFANSLNHGEQGQNALMGDGSVVWMTTPVTKSKDNIWLPRQLEEIITRLTEPTKARPIEGIETPAGPEDCQVGP